MSQTIEKPNKIGRPSTYTPELGERIIAEFSSGRTLYEICQREEWAPHAAHVILHWAELFPAFNLALARARRFHADAMAFSTLNMLENERDPHRARVAIQARQWLSGKLDSARFGDKVQLEVEHKVNLGEALNTARARLSPISDRSQVIEAQAVDVTRQITSAATDEQSGDADLPDFFD